MINDPLFIDQHNLWQIQLPMGQLYFPESLGDDVTVAVIDSGSDLGHPDFYVQDMNTGELRSAFVDGSMWPVRQQFFPGTEFDFIIGHGTAVAGIIGARGGNGEGILGVSPNCRILSIALETWNEQEVADAIASAARSGASVINMSFGQYGALENGQPDPYDQWWQWPDNIRWNTSDDGVISKAIDDAFANGVVMCAAAGNSNRSDRILFPARHERVIACGAVDATDCRWSIQYGQYNLGSDYAPNAVDVVAPGDYIPATDIRGSAGLSQNSTPNEPYPDGNYVKRFWQTSASTPHVSGVAAAIQLFALAKCGRRLHPSHVKNIIDQSADRVNMRGTTGSSGTETYSYVPGPNGLRCNELGNGRLNMFRALQQVDSEVARMPHRRFQLLEALLAAMGERLPHRLPITP